MGIRLHPYLLVLTNLLVMRKNRQQPCTAFPRRKRSEGDDSAYGFNGEAVSSAAEAASGSMKESQTRTVVWDDVDEDTFGRLPNLCIPETIFRQPL